MKVNIPFKERFREPTLSRVKVITSRTRRMANPGDTFEAFGATLQVDAVERWPFAKILAHWREEGCTSEDDLRSVWREIHPRREFALGDLLWAHTFHMVTPPQEIR